MFARRNSKRDRGYRPACTVHAFSGCRNLEKARGASMRQTILPLDDIRVLDLTHFVNGPYATMLLSYLGAQVTKIESPKWGDGMRPGYRRSRDQPIGMAFAL